MSRHDSGAGAGHMPASSGITFYDRNCAGPSWDSLWDDFHLLRLDPANIGLALGLSDDEVRAGLDAAKARVDAMLPEKRRQRRAAALLRRRGSFGSHWGSSAGAVRRSAF